VEEILALRGPSSPTAQKVKVYYATQIDVKPPTLVLFVNNPDLITEEYRRFFVRQLRERLPFSEVPIQLYVRGHHRSFDSKESSDGRGKPARAGGRAKSAGSKSRGDGRVVSGKSPRKGAAGKSGGKFGKKGPSR